MLPDPWHPLMAQRVEVIGRTSFEKDFGTEQSIDIPDRAVGELLLHAAKSAQTIIARPGYIFITLGICIYIVNLF